MADPGGKRCTAQCAPGGKKRRAALWPRRCWTAVVGAANSARACGCGRLLRISCAAGLRCGTARRQRLHRSDVGGQQLHSQCDHGAAPPSFIFMGAGCPVLGEDTMAPAGGCGWVHAHRSAPGRTAHIGRGVHGQGGFIRCRCDSFSGARSQSVPCPGGPNENIMMAACGARGHHHHQR
jgi:hypothetical protein